MTYQSAIVTAVESTVHSFIHSISEKFGVSEDELLSMWNGATFTVTESKIKTTATKKEGTTKEVKTKPSEQVSGNEVSAGVLSGMKKDELVALAKSRGLSHTGTKDVIIARLTGGGTEKSQPPAKVPADKRSVPAKKPSIDPKVTPIIKQSAEIRIGHNKFKNYEHTESGLVFDNINGKVIGKQNADGSVSTLTDSDIEACKKYGFEFVIPSNLNKKELVEDDDPEDALEDTKDPEAGNEEDVDENVDDFIEEEEGSDYDE